MRDKLSSNTSRRGTCLLWSAWEMVLEISPSWGTGSLLQNHNDGDKFPIFLRQVETSTRSYVQAWLLLLSDQLLLLPYSWTLGLKISHWQGCPGSGRRLHCIKLHTGSPLQGSHQNLWSVLSLLSPHHLGEQERKKEHHWGLLASEGQPSQEEVPVTAGLHESLPWGIRHMGSVAGTSAAWAVFSAALALFLPIV